MQQEEEGAVSTDAATSATGAGFFCEDNGEEYTVNPMGLGLTNTVFRAELAGIWGWLTTYRDIPKIMDF